MLATPDVVWSAVAGGTAAAVVAGAIRALTSRGKFPRLPDPDPAASPTAVDRRAWYLSNTLSGLLGLSAALLLYAIPPLPADGALLRVAAYESGGRVLGPMFLGLSLTLVLTVVLSARLVRPGPLLHLLRRSMGAYGGADMRRPAVWVGGIAAGAALALHFAIWLEHTTFTTTEVRWRDWPWQAEQVRAWSAVTDVRMVHTWIAPNGSRKQRPHIGLQFADGTVLHIGRRDEIRSEVLQQAIAAASERSGRAVRKVESDD